MVHNKSVPVSLNVKINLASEKKKKERQMLGIVCYAMQQQVFYHKSW